MEILEDVLCGYAMWLLQTRKAEGFHARKILLQILDTYFLGLDPGIRITIPALQPQDHNRSWIRMARQPHGKWSLLVYHDLQLLLLSNPVARLLSSLVIS